VSSIGKRLIDLARANLNALLDKTAGETNIEELTDDELEAELARRRDRRRRQEEERRDREAAERAARERAAERARQRGSARASSGPSSAAHRQSPMPGEPGTGPRPSGNTRPPASAPRSERRLRELYSQLEVPYGAPFDEVKRSFRRLMRKYHPDLHAGNPAKQKTATQLTMSLTQAYNELEVHLLGGPNRR
jgi:DnaJ-domain-containing protein 1